MNNNQKVTLKHDECTFCFEKLYSEPVISLPCGHMFHKSCIKKWLIDYSVKCPICKKDIIKGTPNIENNNGENQDNENQDNENQDNEILEEAD